MANWIVGGALALLVAAIVGKMFRDRRAGKSGCSCGGDCCKCSACANRESSK